MPHRQPPRRPDPLADTFDEHDQPRAVMPHDDAPTHQLPGWDELQPPERLPVGTGPLGDGHRTGRVPTFEPFFDAPPEDPRNHTNVDLAGRVGALEQALPSAAANAKYVRWGVRFGGGLLGLGTAIFVWALASARAGGDATATAREREAERIHIRDTVQILLERDARRQGQLDSLLDALRSRFPIGAVPLLGPPTDPSPQVTP